MEGVKKAFMVERHQGFSTMDTPTVTSSQEYCAINFYTYLCSVLIASLDQLQIRFSPPTRIAVC